MVFIVVSLLIGAASSAIGMQHIQQTGFHDGMETRWGPFVWQNGGEILNKEKTKCLFNEPAAVEAVHEAGHHLA